MSLSPWDLSGNIRFDFPSNRPRRASYLFATQLARRRNESYKNATQKPETSGEDASTDFIEGVVRTKRKDSYKAATRHQHEQHELADVDVLASGSSATSGSGAAAATNHVPVPTIVEVSVAGDSRILRQLSQSTLIDDVTPSNDVTPVRGYPNATNGHTQAAAGSAAAAGAPVRPGAETPDLSDEEARRSSWTYRRNLFVLTAGFILVFSAFRSIQNVQSSLNTRHRLGVVTMGVVHLSMFATCLFAPVLINKFTSKWTIVLGLLFYLFWVAANFYPHFYTLLPTSVGVGFGQSLAWGAQVTYMQKLATGHARATRELTQYEMYKFNGVFLACFQTSHVWGNLVSSLMLAGMPRSGVGAGEYCGVYDQCLDDANPLYDNLPTKNGTAGLPAVPDAVLKLMGAYLVFAFTGFVMILLFLEKIGAKADSEKPCLLMVWHNVRQLTRHKQFRLLIPLLIFNGFEQGFVYSDYNKSYISCAIGIEYVGTNMITLGMTNSVFSIVIGLLSRHVPREAIVGVGSILHVGLMVFLLVWIPASNLKAVYYVISALWGFCDAIWQTQCNYLVNLSCPDDHDVAFQNFRMLQGFGAASVFLLGTFCCVAVKLYIIITLLVVAVLLYAAVEYNVRRTLQPENFDD